MTVTWRCPCNRHFALYAQVSATFIGTNMRLAELLHHIVSLLDPLARLHEVSLRSSLAAGIWIETDKALFQQSMENILKCLLEEPTKTRAVTLALQPIKNKARIVLLNSYNGIGKQSLLESFYCSFRENGCGVGLSVSFRMIELMNGKIDYNKANPEGMEIVLEFPLALFSASLNKQQIAIFGSDMNSS
ncbi:sensor histidine kinase [Paenibacillus albus]|uniref:HAMP domain-containing histidine kinase n=1 Tax=Paenibacillus albus TaxID=2495582 RepID=A0A3S9ACE5_9BACL|nr:ATP-binding protein [Paenibacillus albus]AZN43422.1 HAMP domain-containing histidine kinase [Paenibacillus albus]